MKNRISIIVAMLAEAEYIIQTLKMNRYKSDIDPDLSIEVFNTETTLSSIFLLINGKSKRYNVDRVATQAATLTAWETIRILEPNIIINAGTAGGFHSMNAKIGEIYISKPPIYYHDRRIPLPNFEEYGFGSFPCLDIPELHNKYGFKQGHISSGNSLDMSDTDLNIIKKNGAIIKDMEAAAIAEVAEIKSIPFIAIKVISDFVDVSDKDTPDQFLSNFSRATEKLCEGTLKLVNYFSTEFP